MLKEKAFENLAAGHLLLERGQVNASTSRLYYAMYQAAVHGLNRLKVRPDEIRSGAVEWDHSMVENNVGRLLGRGPMGRVLYTQMRRLRELADYDDADVAGDELERRRDAIRDFVWSFVT